MRRYSEAVKADVRRRMSPPHRQSVAQISAELGVHVVTLYNWRKTWRLQGEVTFRKGVTPGLPFRRPAPKVAALVH
ncbi:transposase [Vulcanococcus sp.]|jgi:transposase-like protein|uniref:transposase n=1 Tax=Vulcanococcus sp. TaxID=2856995 RepID=UPI0037D99206